MSTELTSEAEKWAIEAEKLPAFSGINLLHIKRQVALLLNLIGRDGMFDQYTKHDISHIDGMLGILSWLIPEKTKAQLSPADWLLTVLSIYFHDLGMLVTANEYAKRDTSGFPRFKKEVLFAGQDGLDYKARVDDMPPDQAERFLYQEFVRFNHAARIKSWVMGSQTDHLGIAKEVFSEMEKFLAPLSAQFRKDLGLICESHHLNDLGDLKKYKPVEPFGNSDSETGNIQYCAVLLRSADLLHITSDRTPSVEFRVISPTDPISQREWAKQMAVTRVKPKTGVDEDGRSNEQAPKDTIEVHAYFTDENGFFGLTTYLSYASLQLRKSHDWVAATQKLKISGYEFPWKKIDDSNIETAGFLREAFEFTIDQAKILDLLTGHTLYNDTKVVLRELVQNGIDAIRVRRYEKPAESFGEVSIQWDSAKRVLSVKDDGTGMTQKIISNFLLRVGSSRYQDPEFAKTHPGFSSISRFGIGVLSAFMIADSVEILTVSEEEEQARHLTLRSVHGKYLIRLIEKGTDVLREIGGHGTVFRLRVRPSVEISNILETARRWIVVPNCRVTVAIDGKAPVEVGFESPAVALQSALKSKNINADIDGDPVHSSKNLVGETVRIFQRTFGPVTLAYAVRWSEHFREWSFVSAAKQRPAEDEGFFFGTCVEGIRVEFGSPGFAGVSVAAIANITGEHAPRTNVARSGMELTAERDTALTNIYKIYCKHIASELEELHKKRSFSLTWATAEAGYLLTDLLNPASISGEDSIRPLNRLLFNRALAELPLYTLETERSRQAISVKDLVNLPEFWTIDCGLLRSVEPLIKEAPTSTSVKAVIAALNIPEFDFPQGPLLCGTGPDERFEKWVYAKREVGEIVVHAQHRRIDFKWIPEGETQLWGHLSDEAHNLFARHTGGRLGRNHALNLFIATDKVTVANPNKILAIRSYGATYVLPNSELAVFLLELFPKDKSHVGLKIILPAVFASFVVSDFLAFSKSSENIAERLVKRVREFDNFAIPDAGDVDTWFDISKFITVLEKTMWNIFDPSVWERTKPQETFEDFA